MVGPILHFFHHPCSSYDSSKLRNRKRVPAKKTQMRYMRQCDAIFRFVTSANSCVEVFQYLSKDWCEFLFKLLGVYKIQPLLT